MRVVIDTGIYISAFMNTEGYPRQAINLWIAKEFDVVTSEWQLDELKRVSRYDRVKERVTAHEIGFLINRLKSRATVLEELPEVDLSPDPDDNPILATAIAGKVFYLVSGDKKDLLDLKRVEDIEIITVTDFVKSF